MTDSVTAAQALPRCFDRPTFLQDPWSDGTLWCLERVIEQPDAGPLGFTALAAAPDGTLYAARPLTGQVFALTDADGDGLPEQAELAIGGLTLPNGLAFHDGALYISGGPNLYRWRGGDLETLIDDLPSGGGFWTGGVAVGPDGRLYVATGAPCDRCLPGDPGRGAILSADLDGGDRQIIATGLRQPADLAFLNGDLWTVDSAADALTAPDLDELNRVTPGAHFGWPYCVGLDNAPDLQGDFTCADATAPAYTFPTHSTPLGLAAYTSDTFPWLTGSLLVTLGGSNNQAHMEGFALIAVRLDADGTPVGEDLLIPNNSPRESEHYPLRQMNYRGSGFWPRRPLDVAVSPEGWIYVSAGDGRILALRPL